MARLLQIKDRKAIATSAIAYLSEIKKKLEARNWAPFNLNEEIVVVSFPNIPYNFEAVQLVQKHLSKNGWNCKLTHFYITHSNRYSYTFTFSPVASLR